MHPPIALLLLALSLALAAPAFADPKLDELNDTLTARLSEKIEISASALASAALESRTQQLASLRSGEATLEEAPDPTRMTCTALANATLQCVVVTSRPAPPPIRKLAASGS